MKATVKVSLYATKLRAAIKEAEGVHKKEMAQYAKDYGAYKIALAVHVKKTVLPRIAALRPGRKLDRYRSYREGPDPASLFAGAPNAPAYPSRGRIDKLRKRLNYLAIAAPETIVIDEDDDLMPAEEPHEE